MRINHIIQRGFTFIEMLAVLLIFSLIFLFISLNPQYFMSKEVKLDKVAKFLVAQFQLLQQEAIMLQICYRLRIYPDGYIVEKYLVQNKKSLWLTLDRDLGFSKEMANDGIILSYTNKSGNINEAYIVEFFPNGSFTPFALNINQKDNDNVYTISGNALSQIEMKINVKP